MRYLDDRRALERQIFEVKAAATLFYSDWCPFSQMMRLSFEGVEPLVPTVEFGKVRLDVIEATEVIVPVSGIPTLMLTSYGAIIEVSTGPLRPEILRLKILTCFASIDLSLNKHAIGQFPLKKTRFLMKMQLPLDILPYRSRAVVSLVDQESGRHLGAVVLDRTLMHLMIFLEFSRSQGVQEGIWDCGRLTERGQLLLERMKADRGLGKGRLDGIERANTAIENYLAKQMYRLKAAFKTILPVPVVVPFGGGYSINHDIRVAIE